MFTILADLIHLEYLCRVRGSGVQHNAGDFDYPQSRYRSQGANLKTRVARPVCYCPFEPELPVSPASSARLAEIGQGARGHPAGT